MKQPDTAQRARRMKPHWRVLMLLITLILAGSAVLTLGVRDLTQLNGQARQVDDDALAPYTYLEQTVTAQRQSLAWFTAAFAVDDHQIQTGYLTDASTFGEKGSEAFERFKASAVGLPGERQLLEEYDAFGDQMRAEGQAAALAVLNSPTAYAPEAQRALHVYLATWEARLGIVSELEAKYLAHVDAGIGELESGTTSARIVVLAAFAAALVLCLAVGGLAFRSAIVQERELAEDDRIRAEAERRNAFESRLQRALEMRRTEGGAYAVMQEALGDIAPDHTVEVLVADSSRAHFRRVLADGERSGCGVTSPTECPAAHASQTVTFASSTAIDACPFLKDRPTGPCSAACVPLSIAGHSVGVVHVVGDDHAALDRSSTLDVELLARRAGERIGMVRAFEESETQAQSDPLTGLLNRRSLENQVRELATAGADYAIAYGDLDHFKDLNDTYGHDAGDRALRLFSRVLRDAVRPGDFPARYGGEEFVVVLPDCSVSDAVMVMERVREKLGVAAGEGTVPPFTVSFGVAGSDSGALFEDVLARSDGALMKAKAEGRDRVLVATSSSPDPEPTSGRRYPAAVDPAVDVGAPSADVA
jgi:diguanylate cyclase (GGDEF)-like protein